MPKWQYNVVRKVVLRIGGGIVATNSIYKNIRIDDKILANNLVVALESARDKKGKVVAIQKPCDEVEGDKLRKLLAAIK
jgi:hypothetical protein